MPLSLWKVRSVALSTCNARQAAIIFSHSSFVLTPLISLSFCVLCLFCCLLSTLSILVSRMADAEFFAMLCDVQLQTDRTATMETRTIFSSKAAIQHLIEESNLSFAPGLADMIRSPNAPSVQQLRACSVVLPPEALRSKWIVYLQYYRRGPLWYIYCGKTTDRRGSNLRLQNYVTESNIADSIKELLQTGFEHVGHAILAVVDIP